MFVMHWTCVGVCTYWRNSLSGLQDWLVDVSLSGLLRVRGWLDEAVISLEVNTWRRKTCYCLMKNEFFKTNIWYTTGNPSVVFTHALNEGFLWENFFFGSDTKLERLLFFKCS